MRRRRLGYRPGLDGIRAVAVVAVMAFHGGVSWIPGGFLGVDLFFVLSGFLITTLLLEEWGSTGTVRLGSFWARRARRLFPALALMLVAVAIYGATLAPADTRSGLRWDGLASLLYVANWRFVFGHQSYFASFAVPSPLRHMWSLAVEEQWYVVWPPTLTLLLHLIRHRVQPRRKLELLLGLLALLTVLSAGQMLRLDLITNGAADSGRSYYGTDTHIQVLLVGAMLAVAWLRWPPQAAAAQRAWRVAGLAGAAVCLTMFVHTSGSDRWLYRGGFTLFAGAGALVVAAVVVPGSGLLARALGVAPVRAVGRVSYGLYLWHWPVDVCLNPTRVHLSPGPLLLVRTVVTVAIAVVSYHLVEVPIRTGRVVLRRPLRLSGITVAVLGLGLVLLPSIGATSVSATASAGGADGPGGAGPNRPPLHLPPPPRRVASTVIPAVPPGQPVRVLVVGDSVGQALTNEVTPPPPLQFTNESIEGCGVTFGAAIVGGYPIYDVSQCPEDQQRRAWLAGLAVKPDVVVMSFGTWEVFDQEYDDHDYKVGTAAYQKLLGDQLQSDFDFIDRYSNAHIALLDVPCYQETDYGLGGSASPRNDPARVAWVNRVFARAAAANPGRVSLVPISQWACPGGRFLTQRDGVILRPDGVHYDPQSATLTWDVWLGPRITALAHTTSRVPEPARTTG
jgi:peptidoglycan/LPS O-acetylase OafA/YrhL